MRRVDGPGKSSQTHVFSSKFAHIGQQTFWWGKNLQPGFSFGFTEVSQSEVGKLGVITVVCPTQGILTTPNIYILQPKNKTLLHQMQIASVWQVPGLSKISLIGASNDFFVLIEIENNHRAIKWPVENKSWLKEETLRSPSGQYKYHKRALQQKQNSTNRILKDKKPLIYI